MLVVSLVPMQSRNDMNDPTTHDEQTTHSSSRPAWWGLLIPRASPGGSLFSRTLSRAVQIPTLLVGVCLSVALLALMPVVVMLVVGIELLLGRKGPISTGP